MVGSSTLGTTTGTMARGDEISEAEATYAEEVEAINAGESGEGDPFDDDSMGLSARAMTEAVAEGVRRGNAPANPFDHSAFEDEAGM